MKSTQKEIVDICLDRDIRIYDLVLEDEINRTKVTEKEIRDELHKMLVVMDNSSKNYLDNKSKTDLGMIDGFAYKMTEYAKKKNTVTGDFIVKAMAMAFSTLEVSSTMGKIVAAPTAGSSGILPAVLFSVKEKLNLDIDDLANGILTSVGIGQVIGKLATFSGAEGGCQAECGSAAAMAAAATVELYGGTVEQCFEAASIAIVNVLGLVCDPIGGLVEYPCTFRNSSGVINAMISADMALAGIKSIVPFEEVVKAMSDVGKSLPYTLRETGLGGLAGTKTGQKIKEEFFKNK